MRGRLARPGTDAFDGGVRRRRVRLIAISGFDDVKPRSPGTLHIRQAMEECLDSVTVIVRQIEEKWSGEPLSSGHRLHRRWHEATGNAAVVSIPLVADGVCAAAGQQQNCQAKPTAGPIHDAPTRNRRS